MILRKLTDPPIDEGGLPMLYITPVVDTSDHALPIKTYDVYSTALRDFRIWVRTEMSLWYKIKRWFKNVF